MSAEIIDLAACRAGAAGAPPATDGAARSPITTRKQLWDAVVASIYYAADVDPAIGVFGLALACGFELVGQVGSSEGLAGNELRYDARMSDEWNRAFFARCIARWALAQNRVPESAPAISYIARELIRCQPPEVRNDAEVNHG